VASIEEIVNGLRGVVDKLDEARNAANAVASDTDDAINQATGLSATSLVDALTQVKDTIDKGTNQISAAIDIFNEAATTAQAAREGT
jgi:hypothetical protein